MREESTTFHRQWTAAETPSLLERRVRTVMLGVPSVLLLVGLTVGIRDPRWTLLATAVVFGWSQLTGA